MRGRLERSRLWLRNEVWIGYRIWSGVKEGLIDNMGCYIGYEKG